MEIHGKNILITGAAKRLGREFALNLAKLGANIAVHYYHSKKEAEELSKDIEALGQKVILVKGNIAKPKEIAKIVAKSIEGLGSIDILINNAAIFYPTPINDVTKKDWDNFFDINLKSQFYFAREFASKFNGENGKIINLADTYAASPAIEFIPYGISKTGVISLTKGLAKAYAPNILVNCICPGPILPLEKPGTEVQQKAISKTLLKREGKVMDIVKTVIFLIENDYITGQAIYVDGGKSV